MAQGVAKEGECTILSGLIPASLISMPQSRKPMKKTTRPRAPGAKGRRKAAGTRHKTATSRKAAKAGNKAKNKVNSKVESKVRKARSKAGTKTAGKADAERSAGIERAKETILALKAELDEVRRRIADLQASAETDFLLGILNRRGFER